MAGEMIASAVVKEVINKLESGIWDRLKLSLDFKQDLEEMKNTLSTLQAVLQDAEKRSIRDGAVCLWLKDLKAAAYDIEDMLNDIPAEDNPNQEAKVSDDMPKKVRRFFSLSNPLISRDYMARKMKKMRERLDKIAARRSKFHLNEESASDMQDEIRKRESCSAIEESKVVYGRDKEKEFIVNLLLDANGKENISVIPIFGIGGLGKTTLAQLAFNDKRVLVFDLKIWVYVSMEFDLKRIGKAIISDAEEGCSLDILQPISRRVRKILAGKRYLLVLDDMWTKKEDDWERLKSILQDGKKGSKIIVTTRSQEAASMIWTARSLEVASVPPYPMLPLHEKDSWALFERKALIANGVEVDPSLKQIGKEIARKCGGVPLVINAIASMLSKRGKETWSTVRDSEIWELEKDEYKFLSDEKDEKVLSSLRLSYYHMPLHLRPCFAYCSLFPRGYEIDKDKLIQQWIGQGLIQKPNWSLSLEVGDYYVNQLLSMSFFQDKKEHKKTHRVTYKMHDLVYDLARSVAGDEVLILNPGEGIRGTKWCRYVTLTGDKEPPKVQEALLKRARALHFRGCGFMKPCHDNIFPWAKCLHVLDLTGWFIDQLPSSVYELKQLKYLDISYLPIQTLRESIRDLQNLQVLNLSYCSLEEIPQSIGALQKLHILNLAGCCKLRTLPTSIGSLKNLHTLNLKDCSALQTLPESIGSLKNLHALNLRGCFSLQTLPESIGSLKNLNALNLRGCFSLQTLPQSISNLQNVVNLNLFKCRKLQMSPESIGCLLNLPNLNLLKCHKLGILPKFKGRLVKISTLDLSNRALSILPESIGNLQNSLSLDLSLCHDLHMLFESLGYLRNLLELNMSKYHYLLILPISIGCLENLFILNLSKSRFSFLPESIGNLQNLQYLNLSWCHNLEMLPESIGRLWNLLELNLLMCRKLRKLPEPAGCLKKLCTLDLRCCAFTSLPRLIGNLQNLQRLKFSNVKPRWARSITPNLRALGWTMFAFAAQELHGSAYGEISVGVPQLGSFGKLTVSGKSQLGFTLFEWVRMQDGVSLSDTIKRFDENSSLVTAEHLSQVSLSDVIEEFSGCHALRLHL